MPSSLGLATPGAPPVIGMPATQQRTPSQARWVDEAARAAGADVVARLGEVEMRHRAARQGVGVALLPCFLGDADPVLARVGEPPRELAEDIHLLVHRDMREISAVRATAAALVALFRRRAGEPGRLGRRPCAPGDRG